MAKLNLQKRNYKVDPESLLILKRAGVNVAALVRETIDKAARSRKCPCCNQELPPEEQFTKKKIDGYGDVGLMEIEEFLK